MKLIGVSGDWAMHKVLIVALLLGLVLSAIVVYAKESFNLTIRDADELEKITGVNNLARIEK
jgi:capsular polysaccharide biosynthesis protein